MRYIITGIAISVGLVLIVASFLAGQQFRQVASSPLIVTLDDYPFLDYVGGDLLRESNIGTSPAEMAQHVQQRIGWIAFGGLVFLLVGVAFFALTKPKGGHFT